MLLAQVISQPFVELVAADFVVAKISDLHDRTTSDAAEGQVERAATPIENEDRSSVEARQLAAKVRLGTKVSIKGSYRLVNKLHNANAGFSSRFAKGSALRPSEVDGNGEHRSREVMRRCAAARDGRVSFQVSEDLCDGVGRLDRSAIHEDRTITPERHFRRSNEAWWGATFGDVHVLAGFASNYDVRATVPDD
jgi:hypothetical protein